MTHVCIDRVLLSDLARPHIARVNAAGRLQAIAPVAKQWQAGTVLSVAFIGGTQAQRDMVRQYAPQWSDRCGIKFDWRSSLPATVRISFDENDGAWSYIGTDCAEIPANQSTMNLGWQDQAVILHEFGHALSLAHEHQNPQGGIKWNEAAVIADLSGSPNFWDEATIRHNVLDKYRVDQVIGTAFDSLSIMLYSFPASWTTDGFSAPWNQSISALDAQLTSRFYPTISTPVVLTPLRVLLAQGASIAVAGELDQYELVAPARGAYVIETAGTTDLLMQLFSGTRLMASDDDSGRGSNARIEATLDAGTYRVTVRHYSAAGTGKYGIVCWAWKP